jgi:hypothetical protein
MLAADEFSGCSRLEYLAAGFNKLTALNSLTFVPLIRLHALFAVRNVELD